VTGRLRLALPLLAPLAVGLALGFGHDPVAAEATRPLVHRDGGYVGSSACRDCHADHHASWAATFHRTMTQEPKGGAVRGAFDGRRIEWQGGSARPWTKDEAYYVDVAAPSTSRTAKVELLAGSRRYQQLFERVPRDGGEAFVRLPIVWSMIEERWLPIHAVFFEPDGADPRSHASDWNSNCVFCHTTAPSPRLVAGKDAAAAARGAGAYDSKASDLGIACEACHGPGEDHVDAMRDPAARLPALRKGGDLKIVHPDRLAPDRAVAVCGQCHGQRLPEPIDRATTWITRGPTYRPGDDLLKHVRPVVRETPPPGNAAPDLFRMRFWADGTPRLTAYEYQGLVASPCHVKGGLTCNHCHAMHEGDPRGQLKPGHEDDRACATCHERARYETVAHTGHDSRGPGGSCVACHMPRIVYGVLDLHRSHRIESPDPRRDGEAGRPHACTLCHLDRSLEWSATEMSRLWGRRFQAPAQRPDRGAVADPEGFTSLLSGDPVTRAVYARAAGDAPGDGGGPFDSMRRAVLGFTLGDGYPAVRFTALRALRSLPSSESAAFDRAIRGYDALASPEIRRMAVLQALQALQLDRTRLEAFSAAANRQAHAVITIGE
jgi:hypothetical protein